MHFLPLACLPLTNLSLHQILLPSNIIFTVEKLNFKFWAVKKIKNTAEMKHYLTYLILRDDHLLLCELFEHKDELIHNLQCF